MWEHFVLNEIMTQLQTRDVLYWRDKRGHEVDFVLAKSRTKPAAIECKWTSASFDPANLQAFRRQYPEGDNIVLASDAARPFKRHHGDLLVRYETLRSFSHELRRLR